MLLTPREFTNEQLAQLATISQRASPAAEIVATTLGEEILELHMPQTSTAMAANLPLSGT